MATAVLGSHDALNNRMHLDAFAPSPTKARRRRSPKPPPGAASSPPPRAAATAAAPSAAPRASAAASPGRRSPPPKAAVRKQPSPAKEKRIVMKEVRILRRGEEPPSPAPVAQAAKTADKRVVRSPSRTEPREPAVAPRKVVTAADVAVYAGPAFASAPEPSSLPFPAFCLRRAETEATRGLRCLLGIGQLA